MIIIGITINQYRYPYLYPLSFYEKPKVIDSNVIL